MGAALATPPPVVKEPGTASAVTVIATTARPIRNRDIPTSVAVLHPSAAGQAGTLPLATLTHLSDDARIARPYGEVVFRTPHGSTAALSGIVCSAGRRETVDLEDFVSTVHSDIGRG